MMEDTVVNYFNPAIIITTIIYAITGVIIMIVCLVVFDKLFKLNLYKELVEDHNTAFGALMGGVAIGIAIIIGASII